MTCEICHGIGHVTQWSELRGTDNQTCNQCDGTGRMINVQILIGRLMERVDDLEIAQENRNGS